jgi:hypothetical protein
MKIQISDSACDDLNKAQLFYESQCEGLGSYFQKSIPRRYSVLICKKEKEGGQAQ